MSQFTQKDLFGICMLFYEKSEDKDAARSLVNFFIDRLVPYSVSDTLVTKKHRRLKDTLDSIIRSDKYEVEIIVKKKKK